jgi:hypothetical protein
MWRTSAATLRVRSACLALLLCGLVLPAPVSATEIPEGTHLLLGMVNSISTRTSQPGDYVYMRTASPISIDNRIAIPVGSYVQGVVTHTKRGGRVSGRARLGIRLETLTLPRGKTLKFSPGLSSIDSDDSGQKVDREEGLVRQGSGRGGDAATIAVTAGSGAALGAIVDRGWRGAGIGAGAGAAVGLATVMLSRGREVELRQGMSLDVVLQRPLVVE